MTEQDNGDKNSMVAMEYAGEDMDKRVRKKRLKKELLEKLSETTINGLGRCMASKNFRYRLFWSILLVIEVIGFTVNLYEITERFLRVPLLTQFERGQTNFTWPHITLCNPSNPIPFWTDPSLAAKWKALASQADNSTNLPKYGPPSKRNKIWFHYIAMSSLNPREFYKNGLEGIIQQMSFNYKESTLSTSSSDFDRLRQLSNTSGVFSANLESIRTPTPCYRLAPEKIAKVVKSNDSNFLSIKLYILMDFESLQIYNPGFESRKLYLYITHPNKTIQSTTPYYVYSGTDSQFKIGESSHQRIRMCREDDFFSEIYTVDLKGTQKFYGGFDDCRMYFSQTTFLKRCGCFNPFLPIYKLGKTLPRICTNMSIYDNVTMSNNVECLNGVIEETESLQKQLEQRCGHFKVAPCYKAVYTVIRDSNTWQSAQSDMRKARLESGVKYLKNARGKKTIPKNFVNLNLAIVNLYWNQAPPQVTYEELEYPLSQFISDFGGTAGLWIGLSLISVFELTELVCAAVKYARA